MSKWVPLANTELFGGGTPVVTIADGMGTTVNLDQLIQYANGNLATPQVGTPGMAGMGTGRMGGQAMRPMSGASLPPATSTRRAI